VVSPKELSFKKIMNIIDLNQRRSIYISLEFKRLLLGTDLELSLKNKGIVLGLVVVLLWADCRQI